MDHREPLSAGQRAHVRRLSQPTELSTEDGELNIVPFLDIIVNVMIFVLATIAVVFTATIETRPPAASKGTHPPPSLGLTVLIASDGFAVKARGGNVGPGCEAMGTGLTIPKTNGSYDYSALTACAARLKQQSVDAQAETHVALSANPATEYQVVIDTVDALRQRTRRRARARETSPRPRRA
jgi:biopolymer transport protein ExbD